MRISLIYGLRADSSGHGIYPGLDSKGNIIMETADGKAGIYTPELVDCRDWLPDNRCEIRFSLPGAPDDSWKVAVTDARLIVWNPYSKSMTGLEGEVKIQDGMATAGQMMLENIFSISTFCDDTGMFSLACACIREDNVKTGFLIQSHSKNAMTAMALDLYDRIDIDIIEKNVKLNRNSQLPERHLEALNAWEHFEKNMWVTNREYSVNVPCPSVVAVPVQ